MSIVTKRIIILAVIILVAAVLGRLAVRAFMNLLLGGTLFGGNFIVLYQIVLKLLKRYSMIVDFNISLISCFPSRDISSLMIRIGGCLFSLQIFE